MGGIHTMPNTQTDAIMYRGSTKVSGTSPRVERGYIFFTYYFSKQRKINRIHFFKRGYKGIIGELVVNLYLIYHFINHYRLGFIL